LSAPGAPDSPAFPALQVAPICHSRTRRDQTAFEGHSRTSSVATDYCLIPLPSATRNRRDRRFPPASAPPLAAPESLADSLASAAGGHALTPDIGLTSGRPCSALGLTACPATPKPRPGATHSRPEVRASRPRDPRQEPITAARESGQLLLRQRPPKPPAPPTQHCPPSLAPPRSVPPLAVRVPHRA
jgi:hypothetical protein